MLAKRPYGLKNGKTQNLNFVAYNFYMPFFYLYGINGTR